MLYYSITCYIDYTMLGKISLSEFLQHLDVTPRAGRGANDITQCITYDECSIVAIMI